jgi:hypothetical protein
MAQRYFKCFSLNERDGKDLEKALKVADKKLVEVLREWTREILRKEN